MNSGRKKFRLKDASPGPSYHKVMRWDRERVGPTELGMSNGDEEDDKGGRKGI